jgi:hypothetical protein
MHLRACGRARGLVRLHWIASGGWHNALVAALPETRYTRHNDGYLVLYR